MGLRSSTACWRRIPWGTCNDLARYLFISVEHPICLCIQNENEIADFAFAYILTNVLILLLFLSDTHKGPVMAAQFDPDERIEVAWKMLNADQVGQICNAVTNMTIMPRIRVLDLTDNGLGPALTEQLAVALEGSMVEECIIRFNKIGKLGCDALASTVNASSKLQLLDIRGNHLQLPEVKKLLKSIELSTSITHLGLGANDLGPDGAAFISGLMAKNHFITHLDLWQNNIGPDGAEHIAEVLESSGCTLRSLDLWSAHLGPRGSERIVDALRRNATLRRLSIGNNNCGDAPCAAFAEALQKNKTLEDLDLRSNSITAAGIAALAPSFAQHQSLQRLQLSSNPIQASGVEALVRALQSNVHLTSLDLWSCGVGSGGATRIAGLIASNTTLVEVNLAENGIDDAGAEALARALPMARRLSVLDLVGNTVGPHGAQLLMEAVQQNKGIASLSLHGNSINRLVQKRIDTLLGERRQQVASAFAQPRRGSTQGALPGIVKSAATGTSPSRRPNALPYD